MELLQENIHMDTVSKEGMVQISLEEDVNLPEMKPDVSSLCLEKGIVVIEEVRPGTDAVSIRGRLMFSVLYHTQEDGRRLACMEGKVPFEEKIRIEGLSGTDNVTACGEVEDLAVSMINSRKLSVQSVVTLMASVEEIHDEILPVGVDATNEDGDPQYRQVPMDFTYVCLCKRDVCRVKEECILPSGYPNIGQILWKNVEFGEMNFRLGDEKMTVQGELRVFVLYESEGETTAPQIYETVIPISEEIACSGCREGETLDVRYGLSQCELEPRADMDGEQRVLGVEATVDLRICVYEEKHMDVMTDIYGVTQEISGEKKTVHLEKLLRSVTGKTKVTDHVRLGENDQVLQLIHSEAQAALTDVETVEDGVSLRGNLTLKILYVTGDDEKPYGCMKRVIPFEYLLEIPGMTKGADSGRIQTELEQLNVTMLDGEELDVKAVLCFSTTCMEPMEAEVIGTIRQEPLDMEKMAALPGMVIYVVKPGDNLWNIGKKYYVPVDRLLELNDLSGQEVEAGQKLLIVKGA